MNVLPTLFAIALGVSLSCPVAAQTQQPSSPSARPAPTLTFYYFREVESESQKYPNRPVQANVTKDAQGHEQYTFFDQRNNETFHDGAWIEAHFAQVLAGGTRRRPGTTRDTLPSSLSTPYAHARVYFTPEQRTRTVALSREFRAWHHLLDASPVVITAADVEPSCIVNMSGGGTAQPVIEQRFTAGGAKKYAAFTRAHVGEIVGIVVDDKVISAPYIEEPITGGQGEISGGFATLEEAQGVADRMNAAARAASEP